VESAEVCNRDGGPAAVMGSGLITPVVGLHTQVWEVEATTEVGFHQTFL
jgi:hypothetical protein